MSSGRWRRVKTPRMFCGETLGRVHPLHLRPGTSPGLRSGSQPGRVLRHPGGYNPVHPQVWTNPLIPFPLALPRGSFGGKFGHCLEGQTEKITAPFSASAFMVGVLSYLPGGLWEHPSEISGERNPQGVLVSCPALPFGGFDNGPLRVFLPLVFLAQ